MGLSSQGDGRGRNGKIQKYTKQTDMEIQDNQEGRRTVDQH